MYGNVDTGKGKIWVPGPPPRGSTHRGVSKDVSRELDPPEENPYEPLDPPSAPSSQKQAPHPPGAPPGAPRHRLARGVGGSEPPRPFWGGCGGRGRLWLLLLGGSGLLNILLLALGARHVSALTAALEAEKVKPPPPPAASGSFLLYNEHHSRCVVAAGRLLTATQCQPGATSQRFQWLPGGRLWNSGSGLCVAATSRQNLALVRLAPCREDSRLQRWECRPGALLALAGLELHFNYGNNAQNEVMLYTGTGEWSRWVVHGTKDDLCSRAGCPPCSKGWVYFWNSCYFFSKTETSWTEAQGFCSALGAELLEVEELQEKKHVQALLQSPAWLGIRDEELEGTWKRRDGSVLPRNGSWWHRDEPNGGTLENCAGLGPDGQWFDYPCAGKLRWVCEGTP
ncbi:macrophage mannose receptor 1-like [Manacus candei]|uniref:macrophage mannose receptor 1-like n=1 Tax=Manacus candei TaxID=415023 RepID=UPI002226C02E|nr:macrophage mannose receptor 1-like [Manacus candei]